MRLIDADKIDYLMVKRNGMELYMVWKGQILNMPTIDAVPVVRCKDCKHRPVDPEGKNYGQDLIFPDDYKCPCRCEDQWYSWMPNDEWFCANGARRTDE